MGNEPILQFVGIFFIISAAFLLAVWCYAATLAVKDRWEAGRATAGFYIFAAFIPYTITFGAILALLNAWGWLPK